MVSIEVHSIIDLFIFMRNIREYSCKKVIMDLQDLKYLDYSDMSLLRKVSEVSSNNKIDLRMKNLSKLKSSYYTENEIRTSLGTPSKKKTA